MSEIIFHIIRLLKTGFAPSELVSKHGYWQDDVDVALRCIAYVEECMRSRGEGK